MLPIRLEDYPDSNWCPDCGMPANLCSCDQIEKEEWLEDELSWRLFSGDDDDDELEFDYHDVGYG